jgi:hypothetical protein
MIRWQKLRETAALVLAQAAGMLAVAVAFLSVAYSALEPLATRCGPECERLHAQLWLYTLAAAAAVPILAFTAVFLARRPPPAEVQRQAPEELRGLVEQLEREGFSVGAAHRLPVGEPSGYVLYIVGKWGITDRELRRLEDVLA